MPGEAGQRCRSTSGERRRGTLHPDAGQPVQPDRLDQRLDLRLRSAEHDRAAVDAQPAGEHGEVDHQRRIGEYELGQVDSDVGVSVQCARQRLPAEPLCVPVFVAHAAERRRLVIEVDDSANLPKPPVR